MRSVLDQDYPSIEYIVMDGGSTDETPRIVESYRPRLAFYQSAPDRGQAHAINEGWSRATGEIVAWLNSDDVYLPGAVRQAVEALSQYPEAGGVYADGIMVDRDLALLDRHYYRPLSLLDLLSFEVILQPTVFLRRSALDQVGHLDPTYQLILDHELWIRLAAQFPLVHVRAFWALERTHGEAKTISQAGGFVQEAERLIASAAASPVLGPWVEGHRSRVYAGLDVFAARRLIDAGRYREAWRRIVSALRRHPPTVARYWYKAVQAGASAAGMAGVFEWYRRTRRRFVYGPRKVVG